MNWLGWLAIGMFIGSCIGVYVMALMNAASTADNLLLGSKQYDETD